MASFSPTQVDTSVSTPVLTPVQTPVQEARKYTDSPAREQGTTDSMATLSLSYPETVDASDDALDDATQYNTIGLAGAAQGHITSRPRSWMNPFLSDNATRQYNPMAAGLEDAKTQQGSTATGTGTADNSNTKNTKYCYRHRPDLKCRRPADEPSMAELQNELATLSQSDQQAISHVWSIFAAAASQQRKLLLQGILAQCCFPQLSFISASVRELVKIDFLTMLPPELGLRILCFLDHTSLCKAAQVSRQWRELADDDTVWHTMCEQHIGRKCTKCGWGLPLLDRKRLRTEKRQHQLRLNGTQAAAKHIASTLGDYSSSDDTSPHPPPLPTSSSSNEQSPRPESRKRHVDDVYEEGDTSTKKIRTPSDNYAVDSSYFKPSRPRIQPWKSVYRDRFKIGTNWKYGRCSIKTLEGHTNGVMCLQFDDEILASGSWDSTIKIWDIETGELIRTLTGHTLGVRCLQFDKHKLCSGSLDGTLKMWNLKDGRVVRTFPGHNGPVISLHFDASILASGSQDMTIRVRDFKNCSRVVLRGHTNWVNAVKVDSASETLFSASDDGTVRMWDLIAKRCVRVFRGHEGHVQSCLPMPLEFEVPDYDEDEAEEREENARGTNPPRRSQLLCLGNDPDRPAYPRYMFTGGLDSTIRLWDVKTGRCIRTFFGHMQGIWSLAADTLRMVSGGNDKMVKIWDPRTGRCERTITAHRGPVTCVGLSDRRMCTGGEDNVIKVYNFELGSEDSQPPA